MPVKTIETGCTPDEGPENHEQGLGAQLSVEPPTAQKKEQNR
jgi:hypothetical protein